MKKILSLLFLLPMMVVAQTQTENYIKNTIYKVATTSSIVVPTATQASQNITYFDGLGRPIQQIAHQQSGTGKDIVTPIEYDAFGRQLKEYLPYVPNTTASRDYKTTALADALGYYATGNTNLEATTNPFSEKLLESSPLNRVMQQAAPGNDWAMALHHTIKLDYQTNAVSEVKLFATTTIWNATSGLFDVSLTNATGTIFYDANQLYKTLTYDENTAASPTESAGSTVEFKNKEGQVILKRTYEAGAKHDTFYVYDSYGNLTYVIPPKADAAITATILNDLCYQYKYDYRNRLVEKKIPGKQWEFIVYDKLDRPVATGPVFSPFNDTATGVVGWLITKYDVFNRVVYTGWEQSTTANSTGRATKQTAQNNLTTTLNETKQTTGTIDNIAAYYSNAVAPTSFKLLTVNYYDDYNFVNAPTFPAYSFDGVSSFYNNSTMKPKGLPTGSWARTLTTSSSVTGETSYTLYDNKARPVRTYTTNYLGGFTRTDIKIDFSGKTYQTYTTHKRSSAEAQILVQEYFTYTPQDRLFTHTHQVNSLPMQLLASNTYDELGQLISKNVGNTTTTPLQKVDYAYNIRGWLTGINNTANLIQGTDPKDLFTFKINYNAVENCTGYTGTPLYNGNISETYWRTASDNVVRKYGYKYDNLNRLKDAIYQKPGVTPALTLVTNAYNENLTYDKNGNITTLKRNGDLDPQIGPIVIDDLLNYYNGNKLVYVEDKSYNSSGYHSGFDDHNKGVMYTYDVNGNLTYIDNKNTFTSLAYNHLNLPTTINQTELGVNVGTISYVYNANGQKVKKTLTQGSTITETNYLGGFQYQNNVLQFFPTAEGYVKNTTGAYSYVFNYKDHLGNIRLSYQDIDNSGTIANSEILEENNYYPFGLRHKGYNSAVTSTNHVSKLLYNGKELQEELGLNMYDYGARNYDPALGRWMCIDPLAEKFYSSSSYNYTDNDPVNRLDADGMDWYKVSGEDNASQESYKWIEGSGKQKGYDHIGEHLVVSPNENSMLFFSGQKMVGSLDLNSDQGKKFALVALEGGFVNQNNRREWVKNNSGYDTGLKASDGGKIVRETFSGLLSISASLENRLGVKSKSSMKSFGSDGKTYESLFGQYDAASKISDFYNIIYNRAANQGGLMKAYGAQATIGFLWDTFTATRLNNAASTLNTLYGKKGFNGNEVYAYAHNSFGGLLWNQRDMKIPFNTLIITMATADGIK